VPGDGCGDGSDHVVRTAPAAATADDEQRRVLGEGEEMLDRRTGMRSHVDVQATWVGLAAQPYVVDDADGLVPNDRQVDRVDPVR